VSGHGEEFGLLLSWVRHEKVTISSPFSLELIKYFPNLAVILLDAEFLGLW
jgi:hypothetical protein